MNIFNIFFTVEDDGFDARRELHGNFGGVKGSESGDKEAGIETSDAIFGDFGFDFGIVFTKLVGDGADGKGVRGFGFTNDGTIN